MILFISNLKKKSSQLQDGELKVVLMKKAKTKSDDPTHCIKIKTLYFHYNAQFFSRK
jgi:hypothetical protein